MNTQVHLHGGPLDGNCHELEYGFPQPSKMGLPDADGKHLHWYKTTIEGHAEFERTDERNAT